MSWSSYARDPVGGPVTGLPLGGLESSEKGVVLLEVGPVTRKFLLAFWVAILTLQVHGLVIVFTEERATVPGGCYE